MGRGPKPAKGKAKPAVARKSSKNDAARVRDLEKRLAEALRDKAEALAQLQTRDRDLVEALEQQTATREILRVISDSPTALQPVLDAVAENAARLCDAIDVTIFQVDSNVLRVVVHRGPIPSASVGQTRPMVRDTPTGRAVLDRRTIHVADVQAEVDEYPEGGVRARRLGYRTILAAPLLHVGEAIGAIVVRRTDVSPFTERQVDLLHTFADQAVIAIENVRLFTELQEKNRALTQAHAHVTEALEQQTATSEILRIISRSAADVLPVFDAILQSALTLCDAPFGVVLRLEDDVLHLAAFKGPAQYAEIMRKGYPHPPTRDRVSGLAILESRAVQAVGLRTSEQFPFGRALANAAGFDSTIWVPILREGRPIGAIGVGKAEAFSDKHIALLKTFADQAVIAIENVRLFTELQEKNRALTDAHTQVSESLEQQTATSDILRLISSSPTDLRPVFQGVAETAARLLRADNAQIFRVEGPVFRVAASHGTLRAFNSDELPPISRGLVTGRAIIDRRTIHVHDLLAEVETEYPEARELQRRAGNRTTLVTPILRQGVSIGAISILRREVRPFTDNEIRLLKTFADQAVIAIENVRLFTELQERNREVEQKSRELAAASQHKSEFLANMSHELRTPLNAIIGFSEVLTERMFGELNEKQEEYLKDIYASGTHLLSLINDILDLSKIEAGRMELELTDFHLPTALDNAMTLVRERATRRAIALHTNVDDRLSEVRADERKIRQVVLNLLSNAIKFTPEGGRIEVAAVPRDGLVEVSVSDTGVGIAPEDQEAVFEEFRQVGTAEKKAEGTGLGLTLCRKFVELHGGRIWVKSQLGAGSTFTFTIPVRLGR